MSKLQSILILLCQLTWLLPTYCLSDREGVSFFSNRMLVPMPSLVYRYESEETLSSVNFEWNPASESWLHFHVRVCGDFCNGTERIRLNTRICWRACFPCDCNITCSIYGTCCPGIDPKTPILAKDIIKLNDKPVIFAGNITDYDVIDKNGIKKLSRANPDLEIDPKFEERFECLTTSWVNGHLDHHYAIADCPPEIDQNDTVRKLCETKNLDDFTVDIATPVMDARSGIVFKNRYCLQCNVINESQYDYLFKESHSTSFSAHATSTHHYRKWNVEFICAHYQRFYKLESSDDFLRTILRDVKENKRSPCAVRFQPNLSQALFPRKCMVRNTDQSPLDKIHPTGRCKYESGVYRNIDHFCHSLKTEAYRIYRRQNVFCYMCVDDFPPCEDYVRIFPPPKPYVTSYLSFLMGDKSSVVYYRPKSKEETEAYLCDDPLKWLDEDDNCRLPECAEGKRLQDGKCDSFISIIDTLGYKVTAILLPDEVIHEHNDVFLIDYLSKDFFIFTNTSGSLDITIVMHGAEKTDYYNYIKYIVITGHLVSEAGMSRDNFERLFLSYNYRFSTIPDVSGKSRNYSLSAIYIGADMIKYLRLPIGSDMPIHRGPLRKNPIMHRNSRSITHLNNTVLKYINHRFIKCKESTIEPMRKEPKIVFTKTAPESIWEMKDSFIDLTQSLVCPYVAFDITDIDPSPDAGKINIRFHYRDKKYTIDIASRYYKDTVTIIDRKMKICIDMFRKEYQNIKGHESNSTFIPSVTEKAKRYFAMACFLLSAVCLALTIATYALFPQLRTLPGLNTMMLSISLVIAQMFLIVVVESVGYIRGWLCMGLGMCLHYSWLVAYQWMGVCCFHMFTVFRGTSVRLTPSKVKSRFEWYCFYAYGGSAVIVALTIILSSMLSGSKSMGYSPELCVFDNGWSYLVAILSFVLPISFIAFSNLVMFMVTVKQIIDITSLQETSRLKGRHGVITYFKLSSLTGLFWLLTILATQLNYIVLNFISIPFVALQGVFIFLSFIFNANTRKYFSQMFGCQLSSNTTTIAVNTGPTDVPFSNEDEGSEVPSQER